MRKQTKLVAVLSAAALLALGASMTSFAATGWQEENGTWVYYNRSGDQVTDTWAKSGDNWFYLNSDGELATETLVDDTNSNFYYVDANGAMVKNAWVAIENTDAGSDNEPDQWWYYFGANGKAYKGSDTATTINLKVINGKKYAFNADGQMLYGWIASDSTDIINDDTDAWQRGDYYFGGSDDGAMTTGWLLLDITDDTADTDLRVAPVFNEDEDQSRWFCFKSNGKKWVGSVSDNGQTKIKEKTINGAKYGFDEYGRMVAEWSLATDQDVAASKANAKSWKYFSDVESGARVTKGWFKVVAAEALEEGKYNDDEEGWYYADNNGNIYANQIKTIKSKKYAFGPKGRMLSGLKFIWVDATDSSVILDNKADDDAKLPFDTESNFLSNSLELNKANYRCYYFGDSSDGAMKTGTTTLDIDGDKFTFNFGKSGSRKGAGFSGIDTKKYYSNGMLMKAGKDEKYQPVAVVKTDDTINGYVKYDDNAALKYAVDNGDENGVDFKGVNVYTSLESAAYALDNTLDFSSDDDTMKAKCTTAVADLKKKLGMSTSSSKEIGDIAIYTTDKVNKTTNKAYEELGVSKDLVAVVNTSGKATTGSSRVKDGNDVYYKFSSANLLATYTEN